MRVFVSSLIRRSERFPDTFVSHLCRYHRTGRRPFDELSAVIRLAHKYHIQDVQDQALDVLRESILTPRFANWDEPLTIAHIRTPQYIGVINLARLTDTPSLLPGAFYICAYVGGGLLDGCAHEDGTVEHLSTDDLRRCLDGQRVLALEAAVLPGRILAGERVASCITAARCQASCQRKLVHVATSRTVNEHRKVLDYWNVMIKNMAAEEEAGLTSICGVCEEELLRRARRERWLIWKKLPEIFGVTVNGWGAGDDGDDDDEEDEEDEGGL